MCSVGFSHDVRENHKALRNTPNCMPKVVLTAGQPLLVGRELVNELLTRVGLRGLILILIV